MFQLIKKLQGHSRLQVSFSCYSLIILEKN
uniref:Uncharacterized protein n=1 Tax=Rhizophora mucronata TaxID=61149 RepID=A0A2P2N8G2_RHIMU